MYRRYLAGIVVIAAAMPLFSNAQAITPLSCATITQTISQGSSGPSVLLLQRFLEYQYSNFYQSYLTGYFGPLTEAAIKEWQASQGIVSSGTPSTTGYGVVGPKTRKAIACPTQANPTAIAPTTQIVPTTAPAANSPPLASQNQCSYFALPKPTQACANGGSWQPADNSNGCQYGWECTSPTPSAASPVTTTVTPVTTTVPVPTSVPIATASACTFNNQSIASGASVTGYQTASVSYGQTCASQQLTCNNGTLSNASSYPYAACTVAAGSSCSFDNQSIPSGQSISAYQSQSASSCVSQSRTCTNGTLSGSYQYASCTDVAGSCSLAGQTIQSGLSQYFYSAASVPAGTSCSAVSESRTCLNGALTGDLSYQYASCSVAAAASCTFNGQTVADGSSVTAYQASSVPAGSQCVSQSRTCSNGTLSGSYTNAACTVAAAPASNVTIDMWQVLTAFAVNHPGEMKGSSSEPTDGHTEYLLNPTTLIDRYGTNNAPANAWIDDVITLNGNSIGYSGTVQVFSWGKAYWWVPAFKMTDRYLTVASVGTQYSTSLTAYVENLDSPTRTVAGSEVDPESIAAIGIKNFGGTIGTRWYIETAKYPIPANGVYADNGATVNEISLWDLGPVVNGVGVYDPEYGHLEYIQQDGLNSDEIFNTVEPGTPSASFFNDYSYGPPPTATASYGSFTLQAGQSKTVGDLQLLMQTQGNLVLYQDGKPRWYSGTSGPNGTDCQSQCYASFQAAGNLVLYGPNGAYWYSNGNTVPGNNQLVISTTYPYISTVNAGTVTWQGLPVEPAF